MTLTTATFVNLSEGNKNSMSSSPPQNEGLKRDSRVTQTDRLVESRTTVVRVLKGGAANQDPRHRSRLKQLEDLNNLIDRLKADVGDNLHAARTGKPAPEASHNTIMCVPEFTSLMFLLFQGAAVRETADVNA